MSDFIPTPSTTPQRVRVAGVVSWVVIILVAGFLFSAASFPSLLRRSRATTQPALAETQASNPAFNLIAKSAAVQKSPDGTGPSTDALQALAELDTQANTRDDRIHTAIVAGEIAGAGEALKRLDQLSSDADSDGDDLRALRAIYRGEPDSLDPETRAQLQRRHHWFGELALAFNQPAGNPHRAAADAGLTKTLMTAAFVGLAIVVLGVVGLALFIVAIVLLVMGKLRPQFSPVLTSCSTAYLEAFALYLFLFVGLAFLLQWLAPSLEMGWMMVLVVLLPVALWWVRFRGATWRESMLGFGWHRGRGVITEMALGIAGYLTCLPIIAVGIALTVVLIRVSGVTPSHPINEMLSGSGWQLAIVFVLACAWAPLMEETMFRGALLNHLRCRHGWLLSSAIVGVIFAAIHPQGWTALPMLATIGMVLSWIREWRGTILAGMAAHALNNGVVLALAVLIMR